MRSFMSWLPERLSWAPIGRSATAVAADVAFLLVVPQVIAGKGLFRWVCQESVQTALTTGVIAALLHSEGQSLQVYAPRREDWKHLGYGATLGAAAISTMLGTVALAGWLKSPKWGWDETSRSQVAKAFALGLIGDAAIAVREELLHRGYAFTTLSRSVGAPIAGGWMSFVFALYHPLKPHFILSNMVGAIALTLLRQSTGSIWAPVGYHWAWNVLQTWIFGPSDGEPSLRPVVISGPSRFVGRPGHPEPGLIVAVINALLIFWLAAQQRKAGTGPGDPGSAPA